MIRLRRLWSVFVAILLAVLACNMPVPPPATNTEEVQQPADDTEGSTTETTPESTPRPADQDDVILWFAPHPHRPDSPRGELGSPDFIKLFEEGAAWSRAASRVDVLELYGGWVAREATTAELRKIFSFTEEHGIEVAFGAGPLPPSSYCGEHPPEGFAGVKEGRVIVQRIKEAGGSLDYWIMDEPLGFAHLKRGPEGCGWSVERVAEEAQPYISFIRSEFPDIVIGTTEPLWEGAPLQSYKDWIKAYERVTGEPLAFFNLDVQWSRSSWPQDARELEQYADSQGIDFSIIYFGDPEDTSDEQWLDKAESRMVTFESLAGGTPERVVIQSWHVHPNRFLPETEPHTLTNLINRYFRNRTEIRAETRISDGQLTLTGVVVAEDTGARAATNLDYQIIPTSGEGVRGQYLLEGQVPPEVDQANVGLRINRECGCAGRVQLIVYRAEYREGGGPNLVPNPTFSAGAWGNNGDASVRVAPSDDGTGRMLVAEADESQGAIVNGDRFNVTAGEEYQLRIEARVAPHSEGGGFFGIFFDDTDGGGARVRLPFASAAVDEGTLSTDDTGAFEIRMDGLPAGDYRVLLRAEGDRAHWPAEMELGVTIAG